MRPFNGGEAVKVGKDLDKGGRDEDGEEGGGARFLTEHKPEEISVTAAGEQGEAESKADDREKPNAAVAAEAKPLLKQIRYLLILPYMALHFGAMLSIVIYHPSWAKANGIDLGDVS